METLLIKFFPKVKIHTSYFITTLVKSSSRWFSDKLKGPWVLGLVDMTAEQV
jgi:hypothetical protein